MVARTAILLAGALALAACSPADTADTTTTTDTEGVAPAAGVSDIAADDADRAAILAAVDTTLSEQVGSEVAIQPEIMRREEDAWAFVYGPVRHPDGSEIEWSTTLLAEPASEGMMDGDLGIVLLNWADNGWRVVETAIGPTDVPQAGWPDEHHFSPALVGQEGG